MDHPRERENQRLGLLRRQVELLEAIADAVDADVPAKEQCGGCGEWFKNVGAHDRHCGGWKQRADD